MTRPDLKHLLDTLPTKPGVYRYYDAEGGLLYVGKAVNLRSRVRSYFQKSAAHSGKTLRLVSKIANIEWTITASDLEALLLEMNLIKRHRPHYNILLKDDKRYPYLKVTLRDPYPTIVSTRRVLDDGARYFGPYVSAQSMRDTIHALRKVFPYLDCDRLITGNDPRACLYHDLGLCLAPCIGAVTKDEYRAMIARLCRFLEGHTEEVVDDLMTRMKAHAAALEFEQAARLRDRVGAIEQLIERQRVIAPTLADQDVIAVAREDGSAIAQVFFVRNGKLMGSEHFPLEGAGDEPDEAIMAQFIQQFYDSGPQVPGEIVVPEFIVESEIIERWLGEKRGTKVKLSVPQRGHKRDLVNVAVENAHETLRALKAAHAVESKGDIARRAIAELQDALGLPRPPRRIECFDVSNLQGTHTVGSMVVFEDAVPYRADYRHFRMKETGGGDDFAAMGEMLTRRFRRLAAARAARDGATSVGGTGVGDVQDDAVAAGAADNTDLVAAADIADVADVVNVNGTDVARVAEVVNDGGDTLSRADAARGAFEREPDLVLVDGGKGQLGVAVKVLQDLGLDDLPLASLAKRHEELFRPGRKDSVYLPRESQALFLVQRARDEAHRFAITYNRKLRQDTGLRSTLDEIPGIGPKRRRALLTHFGSLDHIRMASIDDIAAVHGMTRRAAEQVKAYL
ncbi:MAG: excinuclease ABC subunit UvrC [Ardenticatenales bacterium]